jgi:glutaredoxin 3
VNAERLLNNRGVSEIDKIRIDLDPDQREIMESRSKRRTVPQIFIDDRHIGGFDDMAALDRAGGLLPLLQQ